MRCCTRIAPRIKLHIFLQLPCDNLVVAIHIGIVYERAIDGRVEGEICDEYRDARIYIQATYELATFQGVSHSLLRLR